MSEPSGNCGETPSKCTRFSYDNGGSLTKLTYPSGATLNYTLDPATGRPTKIAAKSPAGTTLLSNSYVYKEGTNDTPLIYNDRFTGPGGVTASTTYTYDALERLTNAETSSEPEAYAPSCYLYGYDGGGNRTSEAYTNKPSTCTTSERFYDYNAGNELECRMKEKGACSKASASEISGYSYDGAGNETAITGYNDPASTSFSYNNLNQLKAVTPPSSGEQAVSYLGSGQSILTGFGANTLQNSMLGVTKQGNESGTSYYARTSAGLLVDERLPGGATYNPVYDAQGDVVGLLNGSGELVQTIRYGPYGENSNATEYGPGLPYNPANDPFTFQGGYHVAGGNAGKGNVSNGLYHFGERYYDPTTGRWTQPDPASNVPEFAFAGDNPINEADPTGLCAVAIAATRASSPAGRYAEHRCDLHRESLSQNRRDEIGNFTGEIRREPGKKGEWSYELEYRPPAPEFASNGGPFAAESWCHIILDEIGQDKFRVAPGGDPHFRPYSTIPGNGTA
jgi:RHS repeat-associated protein